MLEYIWPFSTIYRLKKQLINLENKIENQNEEIKRGLRENTQNIESLNKLERVYNKNIKELKNQIEKLQQIIENNQVDFKKLESVYNKNIKELKNQIEKLQQVTENNQVDFKKLESNCKKQDALYSCERQEYERYKKTLADDLWFTKYGYDWMISDLQMRCIEEIIPGNREKLLSLKNTHVGEECFVIGNGPSLLSEDLTRLKENNMFCFASKRINLIFNETDWRPDIWGASDLDYIQLYKDEISELKGFPKLICAQSIIKHDILIKDALYYPFIQMERQPPWFNSDIMRGVHFWGTITCKLINFAVYMGFKKIYLLGVDHTFPIAQNDKGQLSVDLAKTQHFSQDYYSNEEVEQVVNNIDDIIRVKDYMDKSYHSVKWHCEQLGVEVINATRGGELNEFPRIDFDKLFSRR